MSDVQHSTQTARAISLLYACAGSFDAKGGNVLFPGGSQRRPVTGEEFRRAKQMKPALGLGGGRPVGRRRAGPA